MKICTRCRTVSDGNVCPECGSDRLDVPKSSDRVFLAECDAFSADILEGLLEKRSIRVEKNVSAGDYQATGPVVNFGRDKLYVCFSDYPAALDVIKMMYGQG